MLTILDKVTMVAARLTTTAAEVLVVAVEQPA
jgi:hypothetical protein